MKFQDNIYVWYISFILTVPVWEWCGVLLEISKEYLPSLPDPGKQRGAGEEEAVSVRLQGPVPESGGLGRTVFQCSQMVNSRRYDIMLMSPETFEMFSCSTDIQCHVYIYIFFKWLSWFYVVFELFSMCSRLLTFNHTFWLQNMLWCIKCL